MKIFNILLFFLSLFIISCSDDDLDPDDCAGESGGDAICGCTDSLAANFDGLATHDDGSCEYLWGDINHDGSLSVLDIVALVNIIGHFACNALINPTSRAL